MRQLARAGWLLGALLSLAGMAAAGHATYKVVALPDIVPPEDPTVTMGATAINAKGVAAVQAAQSGGGTTAYRCSRTLCDAVPPLYVYHWPFVTANGIGDIGWVIGSSTDQGIGLVQHGYYFDGSASHAIYGFPDDFCGGCSNASDAIGINKSGQIVGSAFGADGRQRGFVWTAGTLQELGTLGGAFSKARAINNRGDVAGQASNAAGETHAFVMRAGRTMTDLGTLGGSKSVAHAINANRVVVGCSLLAGDGAQQGFVYSDAGMVSIPTLGGTSACAMSVNVAGTIVGDSTAAGGEARGFVYDGGVVKDLNDTVRAADRAAWTITFARGINDKGQIAAYARRSVELTVRAVLLVPLANASGADQ